MMSGACEGLSDVPAYSADVCLCVHRGWSVAIEASFEGRAPTSSPRSSFLLYLFPLLLAMHTSNSPIDLALSDFYVIFYSIQFSKARNRRIGGRELVYRKSGKIVPLMGRISACQMLFLRVISNREVFYLYRVFASGLGGLQ